jgi:hypothetical protein
MTYFATGAIQQYTVAIDGTYDILVQGGHGAKGIYGYLGGQGVYEEARFWLIKGTKLDFVVGGYGLGASYSGGGASVVWIDQGNFSSLPANPLIVAGGGGGGGGGAGTPGGNATFTVGLGAANASAAQTIMYLNALKSGATDGSGGEGGSSKYSGGGGSGWASNGNHGFGLDSGSGGEHFSGGSDFSGAVSGGYGGGGGGGAIGGGGGGGFNGGGGGSVDYSLFLQAGYGGGGGSYISSGYSSVFVDAGLQKITSLNTSVGFVSISLINTTCYLPGTRILTTHGEVVVQNLKIGDLLPTLFGHNVPIKWIGIQQFMGQFATRDTSPVRFHPGSLGDGLPKRDLYVSAGHSMKIADHLVDARLLVNGVTITQHQRSEQIEYYHIDLGEHHCILAEGVWSESYLECNANRETFVNADEFYDTHRYHLTKTSLEKCLPHVADYQDPRHAALFKTLLAHIPADRVTTDPDLHVLVDGKRIDGYEFVPQAFLFRVPAGTQILRLLSRTSRPCELGLPADDRQLGFCIQSLTVQSEDGTVKIILEPHHGKLLEGFHQAEGSQHRWTQGSATLPMMLFGDGTEVMMLTVKGRALPRYHISNEEVQEKHIIGNFD